MGLFEEQPWLLVPLMLAVCGLYDLGKRVIRSRLAQGDTALQRRD